MSAQKRGGKATDGVRKMRMSAAVRGTNPEVEEQKATREGSVEASQSTESAVSESAREKRVRITVDASREQHRRLKMFALDAGTDGMSVMRALLEELDSDPELAERIRERLGSS